MRDANEVNQYKAKELKEKVKPSTMHMTLIGNTKKTMKKERSVVFLAIVQFLDRIIK